MMTIRRLWPWAIWAIGTSFILFQFLLQLSTGVMIERLMQAFAISSAAAGFLSGSYYYIYLVLQTPAGILTDRYGARKLLSGGALVCALGCALFALSKSFYVAQLGRILMGGGSAFAYVGTLFLIGRWFPASRFAFLLGLADTVATLGTLGFNVFVAKSLEHDGWRQLMDEAAIVAATLGVLGWLIIRDRKPEDAAQPRDTSSGLDGLFAILKDIRFWLNGFYIGTTFCIVTVFSGMWGVPFIALQKEVSNTTATLIASSVFIGLAITCPVMGWFYPYARKYLNIVLSCAALICAILLGTLIYFPPHSVWAYGFIMALLGVLCCVYVFNFTYAREIAPKGAESTAVGFTNTLCIALVPIMQPLVGWLLDLSQARGGLMADQYTLTDYHYSLFVLPVALIISSVLALMLGSKKSSALPNIETAESA